MAVRVVSSWGNVLQGEHTVFRLSNRHAPFPEIAPLASVLPYGNGRSYGDSCLNVGAALLDMRSLDRFIEFDAQRGRLACESGVLLADILRVIVPHGWFVPVTPGTRYVTVGGAIANDVHGKNHHRAGTFGRHVRRLELLRSDGKRLLCSAEENAEWRAATIGGLGLTGIITWAEIDLKRVPGHLMDVETVGFGCLDEFLDLSAESDQDFEYTVAWVDCLGRGRRLGRGIFQRANHAPAQAPLRPARSRVLGVPLTPPFSLANRASVQVLNTLYYYRGRGARRKALLPIEVFFYPLDALANWNRLYGRRGMFQYQCVVPEVAARDATAALLDAVAKSGLGSFLAVLKRFGLSKSPGPLSFPRAGITLALDFPNRGERLERLFRELDAIVEAAGGRLYPAKDGRMPGELFRSGFPRWIEFSRYIDPLSSSSFWRRVTEDK